MKKKAGKAIFLTVCVLAAMILFSLSSVCAAESGVVDYVPGTIVQPARTVERSIYDVKGQGYYGDNQSYGCSFYKISGEGQCLFVTCAAATNAERYPACAFLDENNNVLTTYGISGGTYYDLLVVAPENAVTMVINQNNGVECQVKTAVGVNSVKNYNLYMADALLREAKKNPFAFSAMDNGYVTFIFDDLTSDIDAVAAVFEEYGLPLVLAAIPERLDNHAKGLTETQGSYSPNMLMRDVMAQVTAHGGEIMSHNSSPVITEENQYNYSIMSRYFIDSKMDLAAAGFFPRGIICAGGPGGIERSEEIDRWLIGNYEYANMGTLPQYAWERLSTEIGMEKLKNAISKAKEDHSWVALMCHGFDYYKKGEALSSPGELRSILDYCRQEGVQVVTCGYIFDHFSSSVMEERLNALEEKMK